MVNKEHLAIIKQGVEIWNEWRTNNPEVRPDFSPNFLSTDLSGLDLSEADLSEADLSGANLSGANLSGADLSRAKLGGANLREADLSGANLSGAHLSELDLSELDLSELDLSELGLSGANLSWANPIRADLSGADLSRANLSELDLSELDLSGTDLSGANLSGANLSGTDLSGLNLSGANLSGANLSGTDLSGLNLSGANLSGANLSGTDLSGLNLSGANLSGADLSGANLSGTDLSELDLSGANLSGTDLSRLNLSRANLSEANLRGTTLVRVQALDTNFEGATFTGVCIEDWHTNSRTRLDGVVCDYIYLKEPDKERRPYSGNFAPGEFTKLFQKALETVDLIFRKGIDWRAFAYSFKNVQVENEGTPIAVKSIENLGDGDVVIKVSVPSDVDKTKLHGDFVQGYEFAQKKLEGQYQARLEDKDKEINRLFYIINQYTEIPKRMAEAPKYDMRGSNFQGGFAETNYGKMVENQYNYTPEQRQTLAEAAEEIQKLLKQLEENNPTATEVEKKAYITAAIPKTRRERFLNALQACGKAAIEEFLDNPYVNVAIATIEGWKGE